MADVARNGALTPRLAGTLSSNSQNVEQVNSSRQRNRFNMGYPFLASFRFGEVRPFWYERCVARDSISFGSRSELWTHTMVSPLMQDLRMFKDYFYVPYKALMPNSWDVFKSDPIQGQDVPDDVYLNFPLRRLVRSMLYFLFQFPIGSYAFIQGSPSAVDAHAIYQYIRTFFMVDAILSSDSLLKQLRIDNQIFPTVYSSSSDEAKAFYDYDSNVVEALKSVDYSDTALCPSGHSANVTGKLTFPDGGNTIQFTLFDDNDGTYVFNVKSFRALREYILRNPDNIVSPVLLDNTAATWYTFISAYKQAITSYLTINLTPPSHPAVGNEPTIDLSPLYAYQMVGAQFYVRDDVDTIFTSVDWLKNIQWLVSGFYTLPSGTSFGGYFNYNGTQHFYDFLSYHYMSYLPDNFAVSGDASSPDNWKNSVDLVQALFIPFESLRYGDYFVGSRLSPLAVGASENALAPVVSNNVKAIDITNALASVSYYNDIMKLGPTTWIQQNGIYGDFPVSLDPMPRFISRQMVNIGQQQIENTSDNQGDIVVRLRGNESQYAFATDIHEDSIVIGLVSFDVPRIYTNVTERFAFTKDRYDFFNPYFQNIGDQPILRSEVALFDQPDDSDDDNAIAFTIRHTEYKQRIGLAAGAFCGETFLPSWAFTTHNDGMTQLTEDFVRNHNSDFDRFYKSLANISNAGYFHFYINFMNICEIVRAMQSRPGIQVPLIHQ